MNSPERLRATYEFKPVDHLYRKEFEWELGPAIWPAAIENWQQQLGRALDRDLAGLFHYDPPAQHVLDTGALSGHAPLVPLYEVQVLQDLGSEEIVRDAQGRSQKVFKGERPGGLFHFMPEYLAGAVTDRRSWEEDVKPRLSLGTPARWESFDRGIDAARAASARDGLMTTQVVVGGYMFMRTLLGPVDLLYAFHDAPDLVHDIMRQWAALVDGVLDRTQARIELDQVLSGDDACYKGGLLVSPDMFREFLLPYYQEVYGKARRRQKKRLYLEIDTDGYAVPAIPLYLEAGMDIMGPFEVAAGCDVLAIGRAYPGLVIGGGIDKRVLAAGRDAIDEYLYRVIPPMVRRGGYIPTCDHFVPSDVSLDSYLHYRKRLCELDH